MGNPLTRYGENLCWFLDNLALCDDASIDGASMEVYGENEQGQEGSCDIDITELAESAAATIRDLHTQIGRQQQVIRMLQGVG
tara:strand:+ start:263 stop:511 length:249 start_codon:yes stop_codon:yes gene_type:complete